jgi:hypothetical protein
LRKGFVSETVAWLSFLGRLQVQTKPAKAYYQMLVEFKEFMERGRGLSRVTVEHRCHSVRPFLDRRFSEKRSLDMISVVIRHTLVQLLTPDDMRGRVSAVNGMFIGISNELGEFESGMVAHVFDRSHDRSFGPTVSAVSGGIGTLVVVAVVAAIWPQLRNYGRLDGGAPAGKKPGV